MLDLAVLANRGSRRVRVRVWPRAVYHVCMRVRHQSCEFHNSNVHVTARWLVFATMCTRASHPFAATQEMFDRVYARLLSDAISTLRFQLATSFFSSNICAFWFT